MFLPQNPIGFVGERKALALLSLAFYVVFYGFMWLLSNLQPDMQPWWPMFAALCATYGVGFFSLAAEWFWGRWFAIGLGYSGLTIAGWGVVMNRSLDPVLVFYGLTHGLAALCLQGERMAARFDARPDWRERFRLDDATVLRLRHTVTRAAAGLPTMIMFLLAPRETEMALLPLVLAGLGLYGLLRLRTIGALLLPAAGAITLGLLAAHATGGHPHFHFLYSGYHAFAQGAGLLGGLFLLLSALPFARPMGRFLFGRI